ncbi:MAG: hypothetical protein FWE90_00600 [Defluviitaleaceae bacterium]|nr:hypothetical protein [Defluviitaleaceae bacterium]
MPIDVSSYTKRAFLEISYGEFDKASVLLDQILNVDPENAQAYIGQLLVEHKLIDEKLLAEHIPDWQDSSLFHRAIRFANNTYKVTLNGYVDTVRNNRILYDAKKLLSTVANPATVILMLEPLRGNVTVDALLAQCETRKTDIVEMYIQQLLDICKCNSLDNLATCTNQWETTLLYKQLKLIANDEMKQRLNMLEDDLIKYYDELSKKEKERESLENVRLIKTYKSLGIGVAGIVLLVIIIINGFNLFNRIRFNSIDITQMRNVLVAPAWGTTVGIQADGTVVATGVYAQWLLDNYLSDLQNIAAIPAISTKGSHFIGLRKDGTVIGRRIGSEYGRYGEINVGNWRNIVAVGTGSEFTVGVQTDGTVIAIGWYENLKHYNFDDWNDIIDISVGFGHAVGLRRNGTVVATGFNDNAWHGINGWQDIIYIITTDNNTLGLRADGRVLISGSDSGGASPIRSWQNIVALDAGSWGLVVGLQANGRVVSTSSELNEIFNSRKWRNIVSIAIHPTLMESTNNWREWENSGPQTVVGLRADGTVVTSHPIEGHNTNGWRLLR